MLGSSRFPRGTHSSSSGSSVEGGTKMLSARMYGYNKPLVLEDIKVPEILPDQVLVRVGGAGMCRSDVQLIDGYFPLRLDFPITPGHEIAGSVAALGDEVPETAQLTVGDHVVVA